MVVQCIVSHGRGGVSTVNACRLHSLATKRVLKRWREKANSLLAAQANLPSPRQQQTTDDAR